MKRPITRRIRQVLTPANDPPEQRIGQRILDYVILARIGTGGTSVVYEGWDTRNRRRVALKMPRVDQAGTDAIAAFEQEAERAAALRHVNVVRTLEFGYTVTCPFLAMELAGGGDVRTWLRARSTPPPVWSSAKIVVDVARGLDAVHAGGLVHRDVKPGNILLRADGSAVITDFGAARGVGEPGNGGDVLGTPGYVAPEVITSAIEPAVATRIDVYGLGIVAYEMLVGEPPFARISPDDLLRAHVHDAVPPPSACRPDLPSDLDEVFGCVLAKEPSRRFETASAFAHALCGAFAGEAAMGRVM